MSYHVSRIPAELRSMLAADPDLADRIVRTFAPRPETSTVTNPAVLRDVVAPYLVGREEEALVCVALDRRRRVVDVAVLTVGSAGYTIVDPAQVYRWALTRKRPVNAVALAHNHPSGDPTPSPQDVDVTARVASAGRALGIPLLDHLVVTDDDHVSLAERGHCPSVVGGTYIAA